MEKNATLDFPRMRTINQCAKEIKKIDPESGITENLIRKLARDGLIKCTVSGCKYLIDLDAFIAYFS